MTPLSVEDDPQQAAQERAALANRLSEAGDTSAALRAWADARDVAPLDSVAWSKPIELLLRLNHFNEAESLLQEAAGRFPDDPWLSMEYAASANRRGDWQEAERRWARVRAHFPAYAVGYLRCAEAHRELGQLTEAEAIVADGQIRFPGDLGIAFLWGDLAMRRRDWIDAARRWSVLTQCFPAENRCKIEMARALDEAGDPDRADALLAEAQTMAPQDLAIAFSWAEAADRRGTWAIAAARWTAVRERFPTEGRVCGHAMRAFAEAGDWDGAEHVAVYVTRTFPANTNLMTQAADIAMRRGDFERAATRFAAAYADNLGDFHIVTRYVEALLRLDRREEAASVLGDAIEQWPTNEDMIRNRIEIALRAKAFGDAISAWEAARAHWDRDTGFLFRMALFILRAKPSGVDLDPLLDFLSAEVDSGERSWAPAFAELGGHFPRHDNPARDFIESYLSRTGDRLDLGRRLIWKALLGTPLADAEIEGAFETYLSAGRMPIVATIFADFSLQAEPTLWSRAVTIFERFVDGKLARPDWIRAEAPDELLAYLMFAAVFSASSYQRLTQAGVDRLTFPSIPDGAKPETAATALAALLRSRRAALQHEAAPALVSRPSRPLKIALCVSGQLRGFERALPAWKKLGLDAHDVSVFVHTWKDTGRNWGRTWWFLRDYPALWHAVTAGDGLDFLRRRFPKLGEAVAAATAAGIDISKSVLKTFYQTDDVVVEDDRTDPFKDKPNVFKMHHKIERVHAMAVAKMPADALFIRMRPDQDFGDCEAIDWESIHLESMTQRLLYVDIPYVFTGVSGILKAADAFVVGAKEPMDPFANLLSEQSALMARNSTFFGAPPSLLSHSNVAFSMFYHGVWTKPFHAARPGGFLEATILPPALVLDLLRQDVGDDPKDQLERDFLAACQRVAG